MRMNDRANIRATAIDLAVKWKFRRGRMRAFAAVIREDPHDVGSGERAFVDARRRDPNTAVGIENRKIPSGRCGHTVAVNPLHSGNEFVAGM